MRPPLLCMRSQPVHLWPTGLPGPVTGRVAILQLPAGACTSMPSVLLCRKGGDKGQNEGGGHARRANPQVVQVLLQRLAQPIQALGHVRHLH